MEMFVVVWGHRDVCGGVGIHGDVSWWRGDMEMCVVAWGHGDVCGGVGTWSMAMCALR